MAKPFLTVTLDGPFFKGDPKRAFGDNVKALMRRIAEVGEAEVVSRMGSGAEAAAVRPYVAGRVRSHGGKQWQATAVVGVATPALTRAEAIRIRAIAAGRSRSITRGGRNIGTTRGVEGRTHAVRRTRTGISRVLREADLTKGLT